MEAAERTGPDRGSGNGSRQNTVAYCTVQVHIQTDKQSTVFFGVIRFFAKDIATEWCHKVTNCRIVRHAK